jgi:hypothetical protein
MHKAVIAQVNADMGKRAVEGIEKDQIAWLEFRLRQRLCRFADRAAVARQDYAGSLLAGMADETAAVDPGLGWCRRS